jgi:hypothetical protein
VACEQGFGNVFLFIFHCVFDHPDTIRQESSHALAREPLQHIMDKMLSLLIRFYYHN